MLQVVLDGAGGFAGAVARYLVDGWVTDTTRLLRLSKDLPVLVEVVDEEDRLRAVLPEIDSMVGDGLITLERVEVHAYRGTAPATDAGRDAPPGPPTLG